jgi:NAD(P)-dependent dehydrogenase (short-subunit alcohol dehydrogenase family)
MGREIAVEAARQGATKVTISDVNEAGLAETAEMIKAEGATVLSLGANLRSSVEIKALVDDSAKWAGGLDVLVNNAGVLEIAFTEPELVTVDKLPEEAWDAMYDINVKAPWLATKFATRYLMESDRGPSILNAGSVSGLTGYDAPAYSSTKGAIIQLTRATAINLAPHVRANCYCPGSIKTPMSDAFLTAGDAEEQERQMSGTHLIPRRGTASEVAKVVCFLASDEASFMTGAAIPVDGGTMAWRGVRTD